MNDNVIIKKDISGGTQVYGLIGMPVQFSLSPLIHNTVSNHLKMQNIYVPFPVTAKEHIKSAVEGAHALGIRGINVTHPYKQDVIPVVKKVDHLALKIGAVNTLKYEEEGYSGYNTDAKGLYTSLIQNDVTLEGKDVIVLGAGGAARAVCMMAAEYGAKRIYILNRTVANAKALALDVSKYYEIEVIGLSMEDWSTLPTECVCFQTTSVGMAQDESCSPIENLAFYNKVSVAVDLIYNPFKTLFLKNAEQKGIYTINGFGMLFYQAMIAYEIWNDIEFTSQELKVLFEAVENEYIHMNV